MVRLPGNNKGPLLHEEEVVVGMLTPCFLIYMLICLVSSINSKG